MKLMEKLTELQLNFRESKEQSVRIKSLKNRAKRCVCKYCGEKVSLRKITYAAYDEAKIDLYCSNCDRIEFGVEKDIYLLAKYFVEQMKFDHYPYMDETKQKKQMNIAIIAEIISWTFQHANLLQENGLSIPLNIDETTLGEIISITDKELIEQLGGEHLHE